MILFRAGSKPEARTDSSFSPDIETAAAYVDNPGFGGPRIYAYRVKGGRRLDVTRADDEFTAVAEALVGDDAESLVEEWTGEEGPGYKYMYEILLNGGVADQLRKKGYRWLVFTDDFPEDAETWWWLGSRDLVGYSVPKRQWPEKIVSYLTKGYAQAAKRKRERYV